jgi:hypothetical protein
MRISTVVAAAPLWKKGLRSASNRALVGPRLTATNGVARHSMSEGRSPSGEYTLFPERTLR